MTIDDFKQQVRSYLDQKWKARSLDDNVGGVASAWLSSWSRSEKIVVCTVSKMPSVHLQGVLGILRKMIVESDNLPLRIDVYSYSQMRDSQKEEFVRTMASDGIELYIHDGDELSRIDFFSALYSKPNDSTDDRTYNLLYRLLADGTSSTDIKNIILHSVIIFTLYEQKQMTVRELLAKVKEKLGKDNVNIQGSLRILLKNKRIVQGKFNPDLYTLSEDERNAVKHDINSGKLERNTFVDLLQQAIDKHQIPLDADKLVDLLISLYQQHYGFGLNGADPSGVHAMQSIQQELRTRIPSDVVSNDQLDAFTKTLQTVCENNSFINRVSQSESFLGLYKSDKLEDFLSKRRCEIYLDTPEIIYYLCSKTSFVLEGGFSWDDYYYRSTLNLFSFQHSSRINVNFHVFSDYISEVAGEMQKALRVAWFQHHSHRLPIPLETANSFYNFFNALKAGGAISSKTKFTDFLREHFNITNTNPENDYFIDNAYENIRLLLESLRIQIDNQNVELQDRRIQDALYQQYKTDLAYAHKTRSIKALDDDLNQAIRLAILSKEHEKEDVAYYLATWDKSTISLKKRMKDDYGMHFGDYVVENPARLANRLSLANFNVDSRSITYDVFTYADREYDFSSKVKSLYDNAIIPLFGYSENGSTKSVTAYLQIQKNYLDQDPNKDDETQRGKLPLEAFFDQIMKHLKEWDVSQKELSLFLNDENNIYSLSDIINQALHKMQQQEDFEGKVKEFGKLLKEYVTNLGEEEPKL